MAILSSEKLEARRREYLVVIIAFAASGASGLMLEVVWTRMMGWLLGATTWSVMTVLIAFLGGLGLGGIVWGRWAGRTERPLRLFGLLEIAIGLYSLAVPLIFEGLGRFFVLATHFVGESPGAGMALRVLTAVLSLGPPTFLMGGTLPVLTRFAAVGRSLPGRTAGTLYAANTAGAVIGCLVTGCVLIFWLGVVETNLIAALIDLAVGTAALAWDRRSSFAVVRDDDRLVAKSFAVATAGNAALLIAAFSGFCGLAYELLWTRGLLAAVTDDTTYAFTLMLTAFLAGHAIGAALASRNGGDLRPRRDWGRLAAAQFLAALTALLSLPFLAAIRDPINRISFVEGMTFWGTRLPFRLAISLAVFGPSAGFLGASFALAARLYVGQGQRVGVTTGRLYGLNTLGAILGAAVTTIWLIPLVGIQRAIMSLALAQAAIGAAAFLVLGGGLHGWQGRTWAVTAWAILIGLACGVNQWLPMRGVYAAQEPGKLLTLVEGSGAAITVHQRNASDRVISINGVNVAGTNPVLRRTQRLQAHLPVCLHPSPRSVLQIGFGSGGTCYSVSLHPEVELIDVVELNPDVLTVSSEWFNDVNHRVLDDPRVRAKIGDAKSYVAVSDQTYDLILSDSTHPRFRGNAALYSRDYIANCSRRLRPGGLLSTWLPIYFLSVDDIRGILKSFHSVFPHVQVWYENFEPHENTIVIASLEPITIDPSLLARRMAAPGVASDLADVGIVSLVQLLDFFMLGDRAVAEFSRTGKLSTDDHPRLEFLAPRTVRRKRSFMENLTALRLAREPIDRYVVGADPAMRAGLARWYAGTTWKLAGQSYELEGLVAETMKAYSECIRINPDDKIIKNRLILLHRVYDTSEPAQPAGLTIGNQTRPVSSARDPRAISR
jgi:spermidine synthase